MGGVSHRILTLINVIIRIHGYLSQVMSLSPGSMSLHMVMLDINWTNDWYMPECEFNTGAVLLNIEV